MKTKPVGKKELTTNNPVRCRHVLKDSRGKFLGVCGSQKVVKKKNKKGKVYYYCQKCNSNFD